jgi:hypothetical protein
MANTQQNNTQSAKIQGLLARYLELRSAASGREIRNDHLDEDTLNAFTEGTLSEREALPVVGHLSDCGFCRHRTAELVRLELEFAGMDEPVAVRETSEPVSISSVLSNILSRIFGPTEGAVFAHEEKKDQAQKAPAHDSENDAESSDDQPS